MSNVWISRESWEQLWNAMHNVQIRFDRLLSLPSGGITGDGLSAQFRIDLPERIQEPPRHWCYEVIKLGNDSWQIRFFIPHEPTKAGFVHYRGTTYEILSEDCSFVVSKTDLSRTIYFVLVKQAYPTHIEGVKFVPRLTHRGPEVNGSGPDQVRSVAQFIYSSSENKLSVHVYYDRTIEWYNAFYRSDQLRLDIAFGPTPASTDGFNEFLDGAVQYLLVDEHFSMMVNGFLVNQTSSQPAYNAIAIEPNNTANVSYLYVYWVCEISTRNNSRTACNAPINPRIEFRTTEISSSELAYLRYHRIYIPILTIHREPYEVVCNAAQSGIYTFCDIVRPMSIPLYWINTSGLDFYPDVQDGWILIDYQAKKVVITAIRCFGNDTSIGSIPLQTLAFANDTDLPITGGLSVCCVFDQENDRWGSPYLMCGSTAITTDTSGVSGTPQTP